jgi:hypothetical protein
MAQFSVRVGVVLIVLGIGAYVLSGMVSMTAMIPAAFGLVILLLGLAGRQESRRKMTMHVAMLVALVGIIGSVDGLADVPALVSGGVLERPAASIAKALMAVVLIVYLVMGVRSFVAARRG